MENTTKITTESLKNMRVGEAIHFIYQQINATPEKSDKLVNTLTDHLKEMEPNVEQVIDGYQASVIRLGNIVSNHEPEIDKLLHGENADDLSSLVDAQEVFETMKNELQSYKLAMSALEIYTTEKFGKTPRQMHEERTQQLIEKLLE